RAIGFAWSVSASCRFANAPPAWAAILRPASRSRSRRARRSPSAPPRNSRNQSRFHTLREFRLDTPSPGGIAGLACRAFLFRRAARYRLLSRTATVRTSVPCGWITTDWRPGPVVNARLAEKLSPRAIASIRLPSARPEIVPAALWLDSLHEPTIAPAWYLT